MTSPLNPSIDLQIACEAAYLPSEIDFAQWASAALLALHHEKAAEVTIRIVDEAEGRQLNHDYREKGYATNVLSFPADLPDFLQAELEVQPLGDLVICASVVEKEAQDQHKALPHHWAHLTVHGILHLLGYDHIDDAEAEIMEGLEVKILATLGINNPYEDS